MRYFTYQDAIGHCIDFLGGNPQDRATWDSRRAIHQAYRELTNARTWSYLYQQGRVMTSASTTTGTIAYDLTGGTYERMVTLTGGTWPTWAGAGAELRVGYVTYRVDEWKSSSIITLDETLSPAADLAAGTAYTLYRDTYVLPEDFVWTDTLVYEQNFGGLSFVHPTEWLWHTRYTKGAGFPRYYTVLGDTQYPGRLVIKVFPYPDQEKSIDFIYARRPRPLLVDKYATGAVSTTAGSTTVTASGGATFAPSLSGSIFRLGTAAIAPTSYERDSTPVLESVIAEVPSNSTLRLATAADTTTSGVKYTISDPIDIEPGVMLTAFLRGVEKFLAVARQLGNKGDAFTAYDLALREAKAADSRSFQGRISGLYQRKRVPFKYMPATFT